MEEIFVQPQEEAEGDDTSCCCEICIAVSEVALTTGDLDYIDGFRRGLCGYHSQHDMTVSQYTTALGYENGPARVSFVRGYCAGLVKSREM